MKRLWIVLLVIVAVVPLAACGGEGEEAAAGQEPATIEPLKGTELNRIVLTAAAAKRLAIKTAAVRTGDGEQKVIPYAAVVYDPDGKTWTYTSPKPLTFVRHAIAVDRIEGQRAILSSGPPSGTMIVTVGVAELFGAENGIGGSGH
jgi:hypothetical protein